MKTKNTILIISMILNCFFLSSCMQSKTKAESIPIRTHTEAGTTLNIETSRDLYEIIPQNFQKTSSEIVQDMGAGWNLGNSFENVSTIKYDDIIDSKNGYSAIISYSSSPYSGWDASTKTMFNTDTGCCDLTWQIESLNSSNDSAFGGFGIQIYNFSIGETGNSQLKFSINEASLTLNDDTVYMLDSMLNTCTLTMENGVIQYYPSDFAELLELTSGDLIGATVHVSIEIQKYLISEEHISQIDYIETLRKNPITTEQLIKTVAEAGFGAVRIPITYSSHVDDKGNVDSEWLDRIRFIVDACIENDLYCIINMHHDTGSSGWLRAESENDLELYRKIWTVVSQYFIDYDEHLVFEGYNELLDNNDNWSYPGEIKGKYVNEVAQTFVDTVRSTGGNNAFRYLMIAPYGALASKEALDGLDIPVDSIDNHLIIDVHIYVPQEFCWYKEQLIGSINDRSTWGTEADYKQIDKIFTRLRDYSDSNDVPIVIGEFGCWDKYNTMDRVNYTKYFVQKAHENNIGYFWWDTGSSKLDESSRKVAALINRYDYSLLFPEIIDTLTK